MKDTYRKRAAVIGFRAGVIFHLLTGKDKETKDATDFALMIAEYCLEQQVKTFGEALLNQYVDDQYGCKRNGKNNSVYEQLPPTFSIDDLRALKGSCSDTGIRVIISRWKRDSWITKVDKGRWSKTDK